MNQKLEQQLFSAGVAQRLHELMEKEAGLGTSLARIGMKAAPKLTRFSAQTVPAALRAPLSSAAGVAEKGMSTIRANPLKSMAAAGAAGALGAGAGTKGVMENVFSNEVQGLQKGFQSAATDYAGNQTFMDKMRDLLAYIFNGKALAANKANDFMRFAGQNQNKYFSPRVNKALAPSYASAAAQGAPTIKGT